MSPHLLERQLYIETGPWTCSPLYHMWMSRHRWLNSYIDGLVQECCISSALTQSHTKPLIWCTQILLPITSGYHWFCITRMLWMTSFKTTCEISRNVAVLHLKHVHQTSNTKNLLLTQMYLEPRLSALLQLHLHPRLNAWLQQFGQNQLWDETRNI